MTHDIKLNNCNIDIVDVVKMASDEVTSGPVKWYKSSIIGLLAGWKTRHLVLYKDSTLSWFKDSTKTKLKGTLNIEPVCDFLAHGATTLSVSGRPAQPKGCSYLELLSITTSQDWNADREWFLFSSGQELSSWMAAILSTLSHTPQHLTAGPAMGQSYGQPGPPGQPGQPMYGQPGTPGQPMYGQPGQPGTPMYGQPGQPGQPMYGQPGQGAYGQPMNYGQPQGFGQNTNAGTGKILGAAALGMGAGMIGIPFIQPGMSDVGGTLGGFDMTDML